MNSLYELSGISVMVTLAQLSQQRLNEQIKILEIITLPLTLENGGNNRFCFTIFEWKLNPSSLY